MDQKTVSSVYGFFSLCYLNVICKNLLVISFARYIVFTHTKSLPKFLFA